MAGRSRLSGLLRQSASIFRPSSQPSNRAGAFPIFNVIIRNLTTSKVFIGGMSFNTDESSLRQAFAPHGDVLDVKIIVDRETGRSRGFGFVSYSDETQSEAAIAAMDGKVLDGRVIRVDHAISKPRPTFQPGGGFGPGGYGQGDGGGFGQSGSGFGQGGSSFDGQGGFGQSSGQGSFGQNNASQEGGFAPVAGVGLGENTTMEQGLPSSTGFPQLDSTGLPGQAVDAPASDAAWDDFLNKVDGPSEDLSKEEVDSEPNRQATSL